MNHVFIVNPASGKKANNKSFDTLLESFPHPKEILYTTAPGDAETLAREVAERGEPVRIYACGGDGTLNEVVNGAAGYPNVAITNVPKGTGNDFLKLFSPDWQSRFLNLADLAEGEEAVFDLIDCNGRLSIDVVCGGVDARIGADAALYKNIPFVKGIGCYLISLLVNVLFKGITRPMKVKMGGRTYFGDISLLCVCNGRHYGGGFLPVPEAMPDDGILDALLIPDLTLFQFLRMVSKYATGRYKELRPYVADFHGTEILVSAPKPITVVLDGEAMKDTHFHIKLSEKKMNFFYPKGMSYDAILPPEPEAAQEVVQEEMATSA